MNQSSNFEFLKHHDELLFRLANTAEQLFVADPNTTLVKVRQLGEALAQSIAARLGVEHGRDVKQIDLLRSLEYKLTLDEPIKDAFHTIRKFGNNATHNFSSVSHRDALKSSEQLLARIQESMPKPKAKAKPLMNEA